MDDRTWDDSSVKDATGEMITDIDNTYISPEHLSRDELRSLVQQITEDYLEAFKPPFSTLHDLNGTQRQELFDLVSYRLGRPMNREAWLALEDRPDITVDDIVDAYFLE